MGIQSRLKVIFAERNIRQNEFALKVNISQTTLSKLVNNKSLPTLDVAYRIAVELDLNVMEIWILIQNESAAE
ncbi:helix-turn-helix transcriptional regulator [Paenibacillus aceris]|uniref:DNA-binding XRE family transcriptional regulator n=1 Tax=Paenibacillus aceris TaxID=869555 RepID=A0ABS4HRC1_9BACL|nr:helix-turn-helix transcriptional regulator [Paenibacillus aceris]MBP1961158.1 DNA-binding XRE family transcriptional regulator [Paenibacillus aceris]NHW35189.1 helix-turn-helix transcriptional regulator [Paenibacillus aceris]